MSAPGRSKGATDTPATGALLTVTRLGAGYGEMQVLHDIDIAIHPHEIVAIVGSNAGGKTTLLRALSRVIPCTGSIRFAGQAIHGMSPSEAFALGIVHVPEGRQLFDRMSVRDNLLMGAFLRADRRSVERSVDRAYTLFPALAKSRDRAAGTLSGGEQQMCAIARALVASPRLLMVDEMSLGLAPAIVDVLLGVLADIRKEGVAILLVEQDVNVAFEVADRAYVLETGRIVREGAVAVLAHDPEVRRAYLG